MNAVYFETCFWQEVVCSDWPDEFAIISAYATTGEIWTAKQNKAADLQLEAELRQRASSVCRVTGYSRTTRHAEAGWAVNVAIDTACDIGRRFQQDAIYFVIGDLLFVTYCEPSRIDLVLVGAFRERIGLPRQERD
jgi:hypothetical protein